MTEEKEKSGGHKMDTNELELERKANVEYLDSILSAYRSTERRSKKILGIIVIICVVAVYFLFFDLLGGIWGYIVTIAIIGAAAYCVSTLGISFKNGSVSDGKLAYQACVAMEVLIEIKNGTYRQHGVHIVSVGSGGHFDLYKRFIQFYPEYTNRDLEKLAKTKVERNDMFN